MPLVLRSPSTAAPRVLDDELAALKQQILQQLQPEAVDSSMGEMSSKLE